MDSDQGLCPQCGEQHGPLYFITVAAEDTWFIPAGEETGDEVADFDRIGIVLERQTVLELFDVFQSVIEKLAEKGQI